MAAHDQAYMSILRDYAQGFILTEEATVLTRTMTPDGEGGLTESFTAGPPLPADTAAPVAGDAILFGQGEWGPLVMICNLPFGTAVNTGDHIQMTGGYLFRVRDSYNNHTYGTLQRVLVEVIG